jgi:CheY-like chemotaxis protein/HPt (histidine-containing phosphotransfer) domain-containing protein
VTRPRVLLVEDDPTTRAFLTAAIEALPAEVEAVATCAEARAAAAHGGHALWLLDARLPDGDGASLLAGLRGLGQQTPALAHTAARERPVLEALVAAGFSEALVKPITTTQLHAALRRALGTVGGHVAEAGVPAAAAELPVWDDASALSALHGQQAHVGALRQLFLDELPGARDAVAAAVAASSPAALQGALHKLRASCGFVGAARLAAVVSLLQQAVDPQLQLDDFLAAVQDTLSPS